jgi:uncharacterized membrane protein
MLKRFLAIIVLLLFFDAIYLQLIYPSFNRMIVTVQGAPIKIRLLGAVLCYFALAGLLSYFIVEQRKSAIDAGLLGFGVYAVYETTSYAVLKNWNATIAIIDALWGGVLFYLVTTVIYWLRL